MPCKARWDGREDAAADTYLGASGILDFGSSGAGMLGSCGFAGAGAVDSVFSCGCSGCTSKMVVPPDEGPVSWSPLPLSADAASSPADSSPRLSAFARLHNDDDSHQVTRTAGVRVQGLVRSCSTDHTLAADGRCTNTHALARMALRRSLAAARLCDADMPACRTQLLDMSLGQRVQLTRHKPRVIQRRLHHASHLLISVRRLQQLDVWRRQAHTG